MNIEYLLLNIYKLKFGVFRNIQKYPYSY